MGTLLRLVSLNYFLRKGKLKTLLTTAGVALGVSSVISIELVTRSTLIAIESMLEETAGRGELVVAGDSSGIAEDLLEKVRAVEGVDHAVPVIRVSVPLTAVNGKRFVGPDGKARPRLFHVFGVDAVDDKSVPDKDFKDEDLVMEEEDKLDFAIKGNSIVLTQKFADEMGIGDAIGKAKVTLVTSRGEKEYVVRGTLKSFGPVKVFGGHFALISSDFAQKDFGKMGRFDEINVVLPKKTVKKVEKGADGKEKVVEEKRPASQAELVKTRDAIQAVVGTVARVERPRDRGKNSETLLQTMQSGLKLVSLVSLFVGMFLIYNTVSVTVVQRRREIGVLRALGVTRAQSVAMFAIEALFMGLVGSALGILSGMLLAQVLLKIAATNVTTLILAADISKVHVEAIAIFGGLAIGTGAAILSAILPALGAARVSPVEATRPTTLAVALQKRSSWYTLLGLVSFAISVTILAIPACRQVEILVYGSTMLIILGSVALTPALTVVIVNALRPVVTRLGGVMGRLSADNLLRSPIRTSVTVGAMLTGLALTVSSSTYVESFRVSIDRWLEVTVPADMTITSSHEMISPVSLPMVPEVADEIMGRVPAVKEIQKLRMIGIEIEGRRADIIAFPSQRWTARGRLLMVEGNEKEAASALATGNNVVVSKNLATKWDLHVGHTLKIPTPLGGVVPFRVAGVYHDYTSVFGLISMDEQVFWKYWGDKRVDSFNIYLHPGIPHEKAQDDIRTVVQERYAAFVLTNQELKQKVRDFVGQAFSIAGYIEVMAMLIALLGLLNTLIVAVIERTREIAIIRTIGALARQVAQAIMFEGVLMGFVGAVLGVAAGSILSAINVHVIPGIQAGFQIDYYFATEAVIKITIISLIVALIAAFLPAYRAARTNLLEALEYE